MMFWLLTLFMEYLFFCKEKYQILQNFTEAFIKSFHFLENNFSWKIMQKSPYLTNTYSFAE